MTRETNPHGIEVPPLLRTRVEAILRTLAQEWGDSDPLLCWHASERGALAVLGIDGTLVTALNHWTSHPQGTARYERFLEAMGRLDEEMDIHHEMIDGSVLGFYASVVQEGSRVAPESLPGYFWRENLE